MKDIVKIKIFQHNWSIRFMPKHLMRENENGTCWSSKKCIDIDKDMDKEETKLILTHELVHSFLASQGRCFRETLDNEEVCEFIAWNIDEIIKVRDKVMLERYEK